MKKRIHLAIIAATIATLTPALAQGVTRGPMHNGGQSTWEADALGAGGGATDMRPVFGAMDEPNDAAQTARERFWQGR